MNTDNETPKKTDPRAVKPGEKILTVKIPESTWRKVRSRAMAAGLSNAEYITALVEAQNSIE